MFYNKFNIIFLIINSLFQDHTELIEITKIAELGGITWSLN
jgi:hypothetical protein